MEWTRVFLSIVLFVCLLGSGCGLQGSGHGGGSVHPDVDLHTDTSSVVEEVSPVQDQIVLTMEAANLDKGKQIFFSNCTQCHRGGKNTVIKEKDLGAEALQTYGMDSMDAITHQVSNGRNAMPAFKGRLTQTEIRDVAAYVLAQAQQGWSGGGV